MSTRDQIEQLLRQGKSNKAIAGALGIGVPLVAYYLRRIYRAAGATNEREYFTHALTLYSVPKQSISE